MVNERSRRPNQEFPRNLRSLPINGFTARLVGLPLARYGYPYYKLFFRPLIKASPCKKLRTYE